MNHPLRLESDSQIVGSFEYYVAKVAEQFTRELGNGKQFGEPDGYPNDIEASILDSVFSMRARYGDTPETGVRKMVSNWRDWRETHGGLADRGCELLSTFHGDEAALREITRNNSKQNGRSKASIAAEIAHKFQAESPRLDTNTLGNEIATYKRHWLSTHGAGQATFYYFCMLLKLEYVKDDVWTRRFVSRALNGTAPENVREILIAAANKIGVTPIVLDYAIWSSERKR